MSTDSSPFLYLRDFFLKLVLLIVIPSEFASSFKDPA
jgi:hypothetical protein